MIKLLIADDEPLVCVGIQSMLTWETYNIEVVGTARNGQQAAEMVEQLRPDIVITDIKMPLKTGLELAEECATLYGRIPLFIILTSFEEFDLVRRAIKIQAVDYLVKLELSTESLAASITKASNLLEEYERMDSPVSAQGSGMQAQALREKFFIRLYNNLFESEAQYLAQKEDLEIDFSAPAFVAASCEVLEPDGYNSEKLPSLFSSTVQMVRETLGKSLRCYITTLDRRHFSITFCLDSDDADMQRKNLSAALEKTTQLVRNYFSVTLLVAVGNVVLDPRKLDQSYLLARRAFRETSAQRPLSFFDSGFTDKNEPVLLFSDLHATICRAFEELDTATLHKSLTEIAAFYTERPHLRFQAMDAACNVLYMAISLLPEGDSLMQQIFAGDPDGYRGLYRLNTTDTIAAWLLRLRDGCDELLSNRWQSYRQQVIGHVQAYIHENLGKRLSLNEVATVFNFNPNYLSQLFAKHVGEGFVEYITSARIETAKEMLARGEGKIYEIAERLGFESAFYFSKVFKKYVGVSPREYIQKMENRRNGNSQ